MYGFQTKSEMKIVLDTNDIISILKEKYQTNEVHEYEGEFEIRGVEDSQSD